MARANKTNDKRRKRILTGDIPLDLPTQVALLNAFLEDLEEDVSCIAQMKNQITELKGDVRRLKDEMKAFWKLEKEFIRYKERQHNAEIRIEDIKARQDRIKDLLVDYPAIRDTYIETRKALLKNAVKIGFALVGTAGGSSAITVIILKALGS